MSMGIISMAAGGFLLLWAVYGLMRCILAIQGKPFDSGLPKTTKRQKKENSIRVVPDDYRNSRRCSCQADINS
jgi:hypothetical protein